MSTPFFLWVMRIFLLRLLADVGEDTTIYIEHVAVDGIAGVRSQEHGGTTQFLRIKPATSRGLCTDKAVERMTTAIRLSFTKRCSLRGSYVTRANTVTLDVVLAIL